MRSEEWQRQTELNTNTKQRKHRAKRAKGPGTRPWSGSRGETHCGFLGQSPKRSLRQSLNRRKPTKAVQKQKKENQKKNKSQSGVGAKPLRRFSISLSKPTPQRAKRFCGITNCRITVGAAFGRPLGFIALYRQIFK